MMNLSTAGQKADELIAAEVAIQDKMWGDANERADAAQAQMLRAALASAGAIYETLVGGSSLPREAAFKMAQHAFYPADWDGFRDYGSDVANLVVAAAFLRSEIKRLIAAGEDTTRTKRGEPYTVAQPYMSSDEAAR